MIAATAGVPAPWLRLPARPFQLAGSLVEKLCVPLGIEPPIHRRRVDFYTKSRAFSIEKARRLLGYRPEVRLDGRHPRDDRLVRGERIYPGRVPAVTVRGRRSAEREDADIESSSGDVRPSIRGSRRQVVPRTSRPTSRSNVSSGLPRGATVLDVGGGHAQLGAAADGCRLSGHRRRQRPLLRRAAGASHLGGPLPVRGGRPAGAALRGPGVRRGASATVWSPIASTGGELIGELCRVARQPGGGGLSRPPQRQHRLQCPLHASRTRSSAAPPGPSRCTAAARSRRAFEDGRIRGDRGAAPVLPADGALPAGGLGGAGARGRRGGAIGGGSPRCSARR